MLGLDQIRSLWSKDSAPAPVLDTNLAIQSFACSDVGTVRPINEDRVVISQPPADRPHSGMLAMVADGMGGAEGGEVASEIAVQRVPDVYRQKFSDRPAEALSHAIQAAGRDIFAQAHHNPALKGMGTTCVAMVLIPPYGWAAWVGDSRLYMIRGHAIFQLTEDHSVVQEMVRRGLLTADEASNHADKNLVTRALGVRKHVEVSVWDDPFPVRAGDRFLLCSDGLTDVLTDGELLEIIDGAPVDISCKALITEANQRGARDNVSAIVIAVTTAARAVEELLQTRELFLPK